MSFKDGKKFRCPPTYHDVVMAPAADELCREHGLSVIEKPQHRRSPYVAYMAEKQGKPSHRTLLKLDIDDAIRDCILPSHLPYALERRGYTYIRGNRYQHPSVMAKGWERPVRIDSLGKGYTAEAIESRIMANGRTPRYPYYPTRPPLHDIWEKHRRREDEQIGVIGLVLMLVLELFGIDTRGDLLPSDNYQEPLSPAMRQEQIYITRYLDTMNLITRNDLTNYEKVNEFIANKEAELADWLALRNKVDNKRRRATTDEERAECSRKRKTITAEIKKLRHDINLAKDISPMLDRLKEKLRIEMETEQDMFPRETGAKTQTKTKRNEERER